MKTKGFSDNLQGHQITSKVLTFETIKPNDEVRAHRLTEQDEEVYYVERIRYLDRNPLCIETSYFNKTLVTHLDHSAEHSIFDYLQAQLKINIGFDIYFYIDFLTEREAPDLNPNDPLCVMI